MQRKSVLSRSTSRMILFDLPECMQRDIMCAWLHMKDLAKLNSSNCSGSVRPQMLKLLASPQSVMRNTYREQRCLYHRFRLLPMLYWTYHRRLRLDGILLVSMDDSYLPGQRDHFEWICDEVHRSDAMDHACLIENILYGCKRLRRLELRSLLQYENDIVCLLEWNPKLEYLDISGLRARMTDDDFTRMCKRCIKLTSLTVGSLGGVTADGMAAGLAHLPGLTYLNCQVAVPLHSAALSAIGISCPMLQECLVRLSHQTCAADVIHYARCLPSLKSIGLLPGFLDHINIGSAGFLEVFTLCPHIEKWEIPKTLSAKQVNEVLRAHGGKLTHLCVDLTVSCNILSVLAPHCRHLRQLTARAWESPYTTNVVAAAARDAALLLLAPLCTMLHTLTLTDTAMTVNGTVAFARHCPSLRQLTVLGVATNEGVTRLDSVAQKLPRLYITSQYYSVPKCDTTGERAITDGA